jgi:hypothetical protein
MKAIRINILVFWLATIWIPDSIIETHKVVAFMVTVKLVENRVNRKVGIVIVVHVITQKRTPGMIRTRYKIILPMLRSQEE